MGSLEFVCLDRRKQSQNYQKFGILKNPFTASNNHILRLKSDFSGFSRFKVNHIRCFFRFDLNPMFMQGPQKANFLKMAMILNFRFQVSKNLIYIIITGLSLLALSILGSEKVFDFAGIFVKRRDFFLLKFNVVCSVSLTSAGNN